MTVFVCGNPTGCVCTSRCEFPCSHRLGLTDQPCCGDCAPLRSQDADACVRCGNWIDPLDARNLCGDCTTSDPSAPSTPAAQADGSESPGSAPGANLTSATLADARRALQAADDILADYEQRALAALERGE